MRSKPPPRTISHYAPFARLAATIRVEELLKGPDIRVVGTPERWVKQLVRGFSVLPVEFAAPGSGVTHQHFEETYQVYLNDVVVEVSKTEFRLLQYLMQNKGRVLTKSNLLSSVWGIDFDSETGVVDTYISYLRRKFHSEDFDGIKTVRGIGFQILEPPGKK